MEKTEGFYDFCIPYNKDEKIMHALLNELIELGYKTVAIEQVFDHTKKESIKGPEIFPEPRNIQSLQEKFKKLRILQRITIIYTDCAVSHAMNHSLNLRKYNLIAGQPKSDAALTHCCTTFAGDLICLDPDNSSKLLVNRKSFSLAIKRGMYFELKYSLAIRDSSNRKNMIKIAHNYCIRGKSKNVIFSSGALNAFELRGPYDVANLSLIFGLSEDQGKNAVNSFCRQLFLRAESRRLGKTIMFVKATGPIVFSDSSENSDDDDDDDNNSAKEESEDSNDDENMSDNEFTEQPNKKQRTS